MHEQRRRQDGEVIPTTALYEVRSNYIVLVCLVLSSPYEVRILSS
jgi:hypothetical protein